MSKPQDKFIVRFWGVRGSIPTPGPDTVRYGGNTTCIEVNCGDQLFIIDLGSGMRPLGQALGSAGQAVKATILVTHLHWDHIQGLPFFGPAFVPGNELDFWSEQRIDTSLIEALKGQMAQPTFPITLDAMGATIRFYDVPDEGRFQVGDVTISTAPLNHPGGATAYRFDYAGRSYVHASDHEHDGGPPYPPLVELARGATCMSYDATYTDAEYAGEEGGEAHIGWGHSTWEEAVRMAQAAGVERLVLFHHDPSHTDDRLDAIGAQARARLPGTLVAREGMVLDILHDVDVLA